MVFVRFTAVASTKWNRTSRSSNIMGNEFDP
jgi:hypothetical protein